MAQALNSLYWYRLWQSRIESAYKLEWCPEESLRWQYMAAIAQMELRCSFAEEVVVTKLGGLK